MYRLTEILYSRCAVTGDIVLRWGWFFGTSDECWLTLQKLYELKRGGERAGHRNQTSVNDDGVILQDSA